MNEALNKIPLKQLQEARAGATTMELYAALDLVISYRVGTAEFAAENQDAKCVMNMNREQLARSIGKETRG